MKKFILLISAFIFLSCEKEDRITDQLTGIWKIDRIENGQEIEYPNTSIAFTNDGLLIIDGKISRYGIRYNCFYVDYTNCPVRFDIIGNTLVIYYRVTPEITSGTCTLGYDQYKTYLSR